MHFVDFWQCATKQMPQFWLYSTFYARRMDYEKDTHILCLSAGSVSNEKSKFIDFKVRTGAATDYGIRVLSELCGFCV